MKVQAGPLRPDIPGEAPGAGGQPQGREHRVQSLAGLIPAAKGAEVPGTVLGHLVDHGKAGILLPGQPHKGIALVVLQQDVILGAVALDQGVFQHQGLKLTGDEDGIEVVHLGHHLPGLGGVAGAVLKILADPVLQLLGLAHINDLTGLVHHQVNAWRQGQVVGFFPQLIPCHSSSPSPER